MVAGSNGEGEGASNAVVEESAVLKNISPDEDKEALSGRGGAYRAGSIDGDRDADYLYLDRMHILLSGSVRG